MINVEFMPNPSNMADENYYDVLSSKLVHTVAGASSDVMNESAHRASPLSLAVTNTGSCFPWPNKAFFFVRRG